MAEPGTITLTRTGDIWDTPTVTGSEEDVFVLIQNNSPVACSVSFDTTKAFGIEGITLAPDSVFPLPYRGGGTGFQVADPGKGGGPTGHYPE
jgi:hypothetical protein